MLDNAENRAEETKVSPAYNVGYQISYDANGGTGAPKEQRKVHGTELKISETIPTRTGYEFQGWATTNTATTAELKAGGNYTTDKAVILYAVWKKYKYLNTTTSKYYMKLSDALNEVKDKETIKAMDYAIETTAPTLATAKAITFDLNGQTVVMSNVTLTNNGKLTIAGTNGTLTGSGADTITNNGTATITAGTVSSTDSKVIYNASANAKLTVSGGFVKCLNGDAIYNYADGTVTVTNGTINATGRAIYNNAGGAVNISGGELVSTGSNTIVNGEDATGTTTISGGTIDNTATDNAGRPCVINYKGNVVIKDNANINSMYARTVLQYVGDGTIDIQGGTITNSSTTQNTLCYAVGAESGTVKISGGTISSKIANAVKITGATINISGGSITSSGADAIMQLGSANTTITGGTITSNATGFSGLAVGGGTAKITGGKLTGKAFGIWCHDTKKTTVTLGENDSKVSITTPEISGTEWGVYTGTATFNFYDGILKGAKGQSIKGENVTATATNCVIVKTTSGSTETAVLGPSAPAVTAKLNNSSGANYTAGTWTGQNIWVQLKSASIGAGIKEYQWYENGAWTTRDLTTSSNIGAITYTVTRNETIRFRAIDNNGVVSAETVFGVKIDKTGPTILSVTPATTWDYSNDVTVNATDNESISAYAVTTTKTAPTEWIETTSLDLSKVQTKRENGASWARVFYHNNRGGSTLFANETEAKSVDVSYKYSALGTLDNYKDTTGNWEFMLQYPEIKGKYNRWKQTGNPTTTTVANGTGSETAPGYSAVHIDWNYDYWGGLTKSTAVETFLNGSVGKGTWFYAIGAYKGWYGGIPGPNDTAVFQGTELWARVDTLTKANKKTLTAKVGNLTTNGTYYVWVKDHLGNVSSKAVTTNKVDTTAPTAPTITNSSGGNWTNQDVKITLSSTDSQSGVLKYQCKYSGTNNQWADAKSTDTWSAARNETIYYRAIDNAGNVSAVSSTAIKIDKTAPAVPTITNSSGGNWTNKNVTITLSSTDSQSGVSKYQYKCSGTNNQWADAKSTDTWTADRNGTVYFRAIDNAGNISAESSTSIKIDKTAPTVTFGTNGNTTAAKTASTKVTVTDGGSGVKASSLKYLWTSFSSGIAASNFAGNHSGTFTSGGTISLPSGMGGDIYLWILAQDNLGNQIITKSNKFTVSNIAPEADISLSTTAWTTGNVTMTIKPYAPTVLYDNGYLATTNRDMYGTTFPYKSYGGTKFRISGTVKTITTANSAITTGAGFQYKNTSDAWAWPLPQNVTTGSVTSATAYSKIYTIPTDYKEALKPFFQIGITAGTAGYKVEYTNIKYEYFDYTKIKSVTVNGTAITLTNGVGTYTATANGTYNIVVTDVYGNSRTFTKSVTNIDRAAPTITSAEIKNVTPTGYDVYVYGVKDAGSGVNRVQFPTWTSANGQDDIQSDWVNSTAAKGTKQSDGTTWVYRVNTTAHKNESGTYYTHIYVYDNLGNSKNVSTHTITVPSVTITYDYGTNGGTSATKTSATVAYANSVDLTPTATKSGWTFVGWNTDKSAITKLDSYKAPSSNVTLYAIYSKTLTGTFAYYNNQTTKVSKTIYNTATSGAITAPAALGTPSGYTFRHWSTATAANAAKTVAASGSITISANITYYASYQQTVTATFYYHPGTDQYAISQSSTTAPGTKYMGYTGGIVNGSITIPKAVSGSTGIYGTKYAGVSKSTNSLTAASVTTENTKYYAYYDVGVTYYYWNGSKVTASNPSSTRRRALSNGSNYALSATNVPSTTSAYDSAPFKNWTYDLNAIYERTPTSTASTTLYAYYQKSVTATFWYYNNGTASKKASGTKSYITNTSSMKTINGSISIPSEVSKNVTADRTYTYNGVSTSAAANATPVTPTTANTTYYANYRYSITITFDSNGATSGKSNPSPITGNVYCSYTLTTRVSLSVKMPDNTSEYALVKASAYASYKFSGWNSKSDGTGTQYNANSTYSFSTSTTVYVRWFREIYKNTTTNKTYDILNYAFNEAKTGETIQMLENGNSTEPLQPVVASGKTINLELNGKKVNLKNAISNKGTLYINKTSTSGTISCTGGATAIESTGSYLEVKNATITSDGMGIDTKGGALNSLTITAKGNAVKNQDNTMTMESCTLKSDISAVNGASGRIIIRNSTITGDYGIFNFKAYIEIHQKSRIEGTSRSGAINYESGGTIQIGATSETLSNSAEVIVGKEFGLNVQAGTVYFYNGRIQGQTGACYGTISAVRSTCSVVDTTSGGYKMKHLKSTVSATALNNVATMSLGRIKAINILKNSDENSQIENNKQSVENQAESSKQPTDETGNKDENSSEKITQNDNNIGEYNKEQMDNAKMNAKDVDDYEKEYILLRYEENKYSNNPDELKKKINTEDIENKTLWTDQTDNKLDAVMTNANWKDKYIEFNGETTYGILDKINTKAITIETTILCTKLPEDNDECIIGDIQNDTELLYITKGGYIKAKLKIGENEYEVTSTQKLEENKVYGITLTYDGKNLIIYINGKEEVKIEIKDGKQFFDNKLELIIGAKSNKKAETDSNKDEKGSAEIKENTMSNYFYGNMYTFSIYKDVIDKEKILNNYIYNSKLVDKK